jgi:hypothetical protein
MSLTSEQIDEMLVKDLTKELKKRGLVVKGKKAELIDRLKAALVAESADVAASVPSIPAADVDLMVVSPKSMPRNLFALLDQHSIGLFDVFSFVHWGCV